MSKSKVVLAFSGGLDTTYCVKYLAEEKGFEVYSVLVNTGGFTESELQQVERTATGLGVKEHVNIERTKQFYDQCIRYLLAGNVLKNNTYPLSVSAERAFQAKAIAEYARKIGATHIAHGSTGAGNDQVRFDVIFHTLCPDVEIVTPIRDQKLSREQEIQYLKDKGVERDWEQSVYSINQGLWGTSVGGRETLTSDQFLPEEAFPTRVTKEDPEELKITFSDGEPVAVNGKDMVPEDAIRQIDEIAGPFGIGRDIHVGDTIIGIKGRVGFEAAAPIILIKAHHELEKHVLTKHQLNLKDQLAAQYGSLVHEGLILDPVMRDIEAFMSRSQEYVNGNVYVRLHPYHFYIQGIESDYDMMASKFGSYGEMNTGWSGEDVKGFSKIYSNQLRIYHQIHGVD